MPAAGRGVRLAITALILLVPGAFYVWTPVRWELNRLCPVTGDEPHYLIAADAIVRDHRLRVNRAYARDATEKRICGPIDWQNHSQSGPHGVFSIHGIGVPVLVAPLFAWLGIVGARVTFGVIAAVVPWLFWSIARARGVGWYESTWLAFAASFGLPFLLASGQIYPDLATGIVLLAAAGIAVRGMSRRPTFGAAALAGCLCAALPWLHFKNIAPAAAMLGTVLLLAWKQERRRPAARAVVLLVLPLGVSVGLLAGYNVYAFGSLLGPYAGGQPSAGATLRQAGMIFLGLHFDQAQGLFVQQPLFLLGLPGLVIMARRDWVLTAGLVAAYLGVVIPNSFHECWYGCASLPGRFMWSVAALWFVPLVFCYGELRAPGRVAGCAAAALAVAWQLSLMGRWYAHPASLYMSWSPLLADRNSLIAPAWRPAFPSFYDFNNYLSGTPNIVAMIGALALVGVGALLALRVAPFDAARSSAEEQPGAFSRS